MITTKAEPSGRGHDGKSGLLVSQGEDLRQFSQQMDEALRNVPLLPPEKYCLKEAAISGTGHRYGCAIGRSRDGNAQSFTQDPSGRG